ncbi:MAG TPA: opacity family porin [Pyrinomonadaceae bacterium]|jgi:opacity protein-like surface antigen
MPTQQTTRGGANVGGGLQFALTPNAALDTMYNFHNVFTSGSNLRHSTAQGGARFRF